VSVLECFGSSECYEIILDVWSEKFWFGGIFGSLVAFSIHLRLVVIFSQGAGELGPLGSAG